MYSFVIGRGCRKYEPLLISYLTLVSREKFLRYFFARVFLIDKTLREIRYQIDHYDEVKTILKCNPSYFCFSYCSILQDPSSISNIRKMVAEVSRNPIEQYCYSCLIHSKTFAKLPALYFIPVLSSDVNC